VGLAGLPYSKRLAQADNPIHERTFVSKQGANSHRRIELRLAIS